MRPRTAILPALLGLLVLASGTRAADEAALGTWDVVATTPDGEIPSVMTVGHVEDVLKVEIELGGIKRTVSDEKLAAGVLSLKVMYEGVLYDIEATLDGDTMAGKWSGGGDSGPLTAKRRAPVRS